MMQVLRMLNLRYLARQKGRTAITILGVGLGVGIVTALSALNRSAATALDETVLAVAGRTEIRVAAGAGGMPSAALETVRREDGVQVAVPSVSGMVASADQQRLVLLLFGVDPGQEKQVRDYTLAEGKLPERRDQAALGAAAAQRLAARVGETVSVVTPAGLREFRVSGILEDRDAGRMNGGQMLVVGLDAAREALFLDGKLTAIDVATVPGSDVEQVAGLLKNRVPEAEKVERSASRSAQVQALLKTFQQMLDIMALASVVLGAFLVYNAMSVTVAQRFGEIGLMRAVGLRQRDVRLLFLLESGLVGLAGSIAGLGLGWIFARGLLGAMSGAISAAYMELALQEAALSPLDLVKGLALGTGATLLAGLVPSGAAARVDPVAAIRNQVGGMPGRIRLLAALAGVLLTAGAAVAGYLQVQLGWQELSGVAALLGLLGVVLILPPLIGAAGSLLRWPVRLLGPEAPLSVDSLRLRPGRTSVTAGAVLGGVGLAIGVAAMVGSMKSSITDWVEHLVGGDLTVSASPVLAEGPLVQMDYAFRRELEAVPGVAGIYSTRTLPLDYKGARLLVYAMEIREFRQVSSFIFPQGDGAAILDGMERDGTVIIATSLARREGLKQGDAIVLSTGRGEQRFRIGGIYIDYSSDRGSIVMDRTTYERFWDDPVTGTFTLTARPGYTPSQLNDALLERFGQTRQIQLQLNRDFRRDLLGRVDQAFAISYALELVTVLVALLGVVSTVLVSVMERSREIGLLRALGLLRRQIVKLVLLESGLIGLIGGLLGLVAGAGVAALAIQSVSQSYGTPLGYYFPVGSAAMVVLLVTAMGVAAGLYPALVTLRLEVVRAITTE